KKKQKNRILMVGSLIRRKRPLNLILAISQLTGQFPDIRLDICGAISDRAYYDSILKFIQKNKLQNNIHIHGKQSREAIKTQLSKAAIFVLPSVQETAPISIAEAMAVGIPVVATAVGGIPYMVDDNATGFLIQIDDIESLKNCIGRLLSNDNLANDMGMAGREKAKKEYDLNKIAEQTVNVYSNSIKGLMR
ncbi:MAG: glycosyltransferase family 4 protein, partial [Desulfobacteraceae bacterium]|nr:glycosyltransferase family 4 protein [Desulfobacteraceae bacterium]